MTENKDVLLMERGEPTTYQEAIMGPNSEKWVEAMKAEMQSMYDNKVWTLVDAPKGVKRRRVQVGFQGENRHGWERQCLQGEASCKKGLLNVMG